MTKAEATFLYTGSDNPNSDDLKYHSDIHIAIIDFHAKSCQFRQLFDKAYNL